MKLRLSLGDRSTNAKPFKIQYKKFLFWHDFMEYIAHRYDEFRDQDKLVKDYWTGYSDKPIFVKEKSNYKILEKKSDWDDVYVDDEVLEKVCELFPQSLKELRAASK